MWSKQRFACTAGQADTNRRALWAQAASCGDPCTRNPRIIYLYGGRRCQVAETRDERLHMSAEGEWARQCKLESFGDRPSASSAFGTWNLLPHKSARISRVDMARYMTSGACPLKTLVFVLCPDVCSNSLPLVPAIAVTRPSPTPQSICGPLDCTP